MINQMRMHYRFSLAVLSCMVLLAYACKEKTEAITPTWQAITESVYASGKIISREQYEVYSKVSGVIEKIYVTEGDTVRAGQILFTLNKDNATFATDNARLVSANADFEANTDKLKEARRAIDLAAKKLQQDSVLLQRQQSLWDKGIGSRIELEQKQLNYEGSRLALSNAKQQYNDLERQLRLASQQTRNNLNIARINEQDFTIRSEVDGIVYKINKQAGELATSMNAIATIGAGDFIIELNVDEFDIIKLQKGQQVIVRMDSYDTTVFEAQLSFINPLMNERSRSFTAEAIFTKKPEKLFANLTLEASIVIKSKNKALTIPRQYLLNNTQVMLEDGTLTTVSTGLMDYEWVEITGGITASTKIIQPIP